MVYRVTVQSLGPDFRGCLVHESDYAELETALSNLLSFVMERGFHSDNPPIDAALRLLDGFMEFHAGEQKS